MGTDRSVKRRHVRIDGRYKPAIEIKRRVKQYRQAIGQGARDPLVLARIHELCELEVLTSELRAAGLRGETFSRNDLFELVRLTNTANRLRLGLGLLVEPTSAAADSELQRLLEGE
jgi:hypothetical protein